MATLQNTKYSHAIYVLTLYDGRRVIPHQPASSLTAPSKYILLISNLVTNFVDLRPEFNRSTH